MSVLEIISLCTSGGLGILIVILSLLQISKININPWSKFAAWIGKALTKDVREQVTSLEKNLKDQVSELDKKIVTLSLKHQEMQDGLNEERAVEARARILHFNDEILHGVLHTKEHYDQILLDIKAYEDYCDAHPEFRNRICVNAIKHINSKYMEHQDKEDFL